MRVQDLRATRAFYEQRRFSQTYQFPSDGEPGFVTMERGNSRIGIGAGGDGEEDTLRMWVYVDDVDGVAGLHTSGAPIVAEPEDQPWGRASRSNQRSRRKPGLVAGALTSREIGLARPASATPTTGA